MKKKMLLWVSLLVISGTWVTAQNITMPVSPSKQIVTPKPEDRPKTEVDIITEHEKKGDCTEGSEMACMSLTRTTEDNKEKKILIIRTGTTDETGVYTICSPPDDAPEGTPNIGIFSESEATGVRIIIDKNIVRVPLAKITQNPATNEEDSGGDGRVEASFGTAKLLDDVPEGKNDRLSLCGVEMKAEPKPDTVFVTQGKTKLVGKSLVYDGKDGIARIDGPITFDRKEQSDPLSGTSKSIEINVDTEATTLVGDVVLKSKGGRVSKASKVEYNDEKNRAKLFGTKEQPAESIQGKDALRVSQGYIYYDLTSNSVYVGSKTKGGVSGTFIDGENVQNSDDQPAKAKEPTNPNRRRKKP